MISTTNTSDTTQYTALTRSAAGNRAWQPLLEKEGFHTYSLPTIETLPLPTPTEDLTTYDWLVFTSARGVRAASKYLKQSAHSRIAAVGEHTARALRALGHKVAFAPSAASAEILGRDLPVEVGERVLLLRARAATPELPQFLRARGAFVLDVPVYETRLLGEPDEEFEKLLMGGSVSAIVSASPSAVRGLVRRVLQPAREAAYQIPLIALGPTTARMATAAGFACVYTTAEPSLESVITTLKQL